MDELAGRYVSRTDGRTLDIAPCGPAWCAVAVSPEGACGAVAMRLAKAARSQGPAVVEGHFDRPEGRFAVHGTLWRSRPDGALTLRFHGERGDRLSLMRRTYPYQEAFARAGEALCRREDGLS